MKKFVELIQRVHQERYSILVNKVITEKIPVTFLSVSPIQTAIVTVKNLRSQGLNITNLITSTPPLPEMASELDFQVIPLDKVSKIHPRPEYIFTLDTTWDVTNARVAKKYAPDCKIISMKLLFVDHSQTYDIFMNHLVELQEVYESLIDEKSKQTFCGYWLGNICNRFDELVYSDTPHYILEGFIPNDGAIVIDGGACDGGSAAIFSDMGYKVYSFELDRANFESVRQLAERKNFVVENYGLGAAKGELRYNPNGGGSVIVTNGSAVAKITTIDSYVREQRLPRVDFIKLDVEGAELDVLKGAAAVIARYKPILALSAYHKWDDFWTLMNFVKSIRSDYEFAMRQFPENREGIPSMFANASDDYLYKFGLEIEWRDFYECVLFAR